MWEQFPTLKKRIEAVDAETANINFQDAQGRETPLPRCPHQHCQPEQELHLDCRS